MLRELKRRLGFAVQHSRFLRGFASDINFALFHWDKRQQHKSFGSLNPSLKFYVIRSEGKDQGLLSLYLGYLSCIRSCIESGFIPVVDWENFQTQYNVDFPVNGTKNAWEYYFEQPCGYTLSEIYNSMDVTLSGWKFFQRYGFGKKKAPAPVTFSTTELAPVKKYIYDIANKRINADGISDMIGILVRGTDYTKLRPAGHPIAPSPETASSKLDEFLSKYGRRRIFLATEDENIYLYFREKYGDLIYTSDNNLIRNYSGRDYVANEISEKNKYQFGLDYLVKMLCLSECRYLIASDTSGSLFARIMNNGRYSEQYIFSLGRY